MKYRIFFQCDCCKRAWTDVKETIEEAVKLAEKEGCPYGCLPGKIYLLEHDEIIPKV